MLIITTMSVFNGYGNGSFRSQKTLAAGIYPTLLDIADFNGDNRLDLTVANYGNNSVGVYFGGLAIGNFNNDGSMNLVTTNCGDNTVSELLNYGNGTFRPTTNYGIDSCLYEVEVDGFNGATNTDILIIDTYFSYVTTFLVYGNGMLVVAGVNFTIDAISIGTSRGRFQ
ncbi:unnamed protein product [Rotaria magnacalcarata]|uniref:VCBS repeat-containing protein n=1 Tax=Rotaria magnacalcarata TaxID=392030 RepID=A0A816TP21_9BILA|nr:unnamed protein product [Rotaria magnacalcarata]CAF4365647.1 unnamed protein product [Rotaria magnacalcarata]